MINFIFMAREPKPKRRKNTMTKPKSEVSIYALKKSALNKEGYKEHYKSIRLLVGKLNVWKALKHGMHALYGVDIEKLRNERLRKGGK